MRLGKDVDPEALRRFREARGMTHEQLADVVWASPLEVAAWEAGTVRVPREQAKRIRQRERADRWYAAVRSAAFPGCAWADAHAPGLHDTLVAQPVNLDRLSAEARSHLDECPTCARVLAFGCSLARLKPQPGLGTDLPEALEHWLDITPRILLYPLLIGGGTMLAVGGMLLIGRLPGPPAESVWVDGATAVVWCGLVFAAAATVFRRLMPRWPYLAGMLSGAAAVLAGTASWALPDPWEHGIPGEGLLGLLLLAVVAGVLAGRWNEQNPWDDAPDAEPLQAGAGDERLAPPDPLQDWAAADAAAGPPLHAAPAARSTRPG
ncbi:MAG TPA: helix-turn-helix transcriptional regulator [Longimicrobium sp.]|jgi:hypothetical protein|nr:helix-turn-helix transcriptional regulator [Longimicrobium sp.]